MANTHTRAHGIKIPKPRCPYCHTDILPGDTSNYACYECLTWHHDDCFENHGSCVTCGTTWKQDRAGSLVSVAEPLGLVEVEDDDLDLDGPDGCGGAFVFVIAPIAGPCVILLGVSSSLSLPIRLVIICLGIALFLAPVPFFKDEKTPPSASRGGPTKKKSTFRTKKSPMVKRHSSKKKASKKKA